MLHVRDMAKESIQVAKDDRQGELVEAKKTNSSVGKVPEDEGGSSIVVSTLGPVTVTGMEDGRDCPRHNGQHGIGVIVL